MTKKIYNTQELNALKGALIALIVLGHNKFFYHTANSAYNVIYTFHVAGFLLFPFLFSAQRLNIQKIKDKFIRYFIPFIMFYLLCSFLYFLLILDKNTPVLTWLTNVLYGIFNGNSNALDQASGFKMYWFLPTFYTLYLLKSAIHSLPTKFNKITLGSLLLLFHILVGELGDSAQNVPWGVPIVLYIAPLGYLLSYLIRKIEANHLNLCLTAVIFGISIAVFLQNNVIFHLGDMKIYGISNIPLMALNDILIISGFMLFFLSKTLLTKFKLLQIMGKYSLTIYLTHALVFQAIAMSISKISSASSFFSNNPVASVFITYGLTLLIAIPISIFITKNSTLQRLLIPSSMSDWYFSSRRNN